jgi:hypothetical protein
MQRPVRPQAATASAPWGRVEEDLVVVGAYAHLEGEPVERAGVGGNPETVHTLNVTAGAVGRTIIALPENGQTEDGSVSLPAPPQRPTS